MILFLVLQVSWGNDFSPGQRFRGLGAISVFTPEASPEAIHGDSVLVMPEFAKLQKERRLASEARRTAEERLAIETELRKDADIKKKDAETCSKQAQEARDNAEQARISAELSVQKSENEKREAQEKSRKAGEEKEVAEQKERDAREALQEVELKLQQEIQARIAAEKNRDELIAQKGKLTQETSKLVEALSLHAQIAKESEKQINEFKPILTKLIEDLKEAQISVEFEDSDPETGEIFMVDRVAEVGVFIQEFSGHSKLQSQFLKDLADPKKCEALKKQLIERAAKIRQAFGIN